MNFENIIREHKLKVTPQRIAILSHMYDCGHINIDDLYIQIKKHFSNISLATLYKNINLMINNSLVKEVKIPSLKSKYEITKDTHAHLLCTKCNEFEDIDMNCKSLFNKVENDTSYKIQDSELVFLGICKNCQ